MPEIKFYHVYRTMCSVDMAAYFGVAISNDPFTEPEGTVLGEGKQLKAHIAKHGKHLFRTAFLYCFPLEKDADAKVQQLIKAHPGPKLNWTQEEILKQAVEAQSSEYKMGNRNAAGTVRTDAHKNALRSAHTDVKWYYNLATKEEVQIKPGEIIPEGFVRGRLPGQKRNKKPLTQ